MKYVALWLSTIAIIMFILQLVIPGFTDSLVLNQSSFQEPWRFISSIFLHGSLIHLIYNLFALILFGLILEKFIGAKKFLLVFFISGIIANLIAINFYNLSLGASGAIFGIIGCLTILKPNMPVFAFSIPMPLFIASIIWIIGDLIQTFVPSNIGTIAHLSGIIIGILFGFFYRKKQETKKIIVNIPEVYARNWENHYLK